MTDDARFEDGREAPLNLGALDEDDLQVISTLIQDAIFPITEMQWSKTNARFALLLNRFRWEDDTHTRQTPERVQSLLVFELVQKIASQGIDRSDKDTVLSLMSVTVENSNDGAADIILTLAGDGAIRLSVEAIEASLRDVTKPYIAPSKSIPKHDD